MADRSVAWLVSRVVDSSRDGLWIIDPEGRTVYANQRAAEMIGRTPEQLADLTVLDVLDDSGREQFREHLRELRRRGANQRDVECVYRTPDGERVRLMVGESEIRDDDGELVGYVHRMISDGQQLEMLGEISRGRAQLADAQSIARLGSWEIDNVHDTVTWSRQLYDVLGLDPETTVPEVATFFAMLHDDDRPVVEHQYEQVQLNPGERSVDARIVVADGSVRWVRVLGRVLQWSPEGEALRIGGTVQDIDEAKRTELQLRDAVELNMVMQFMASAANEASTLREAMATLRQVLLAHSDWSGAVAFEVRGAELVAVQVADEAPTDLERGLALRALQSGRVLFEEDALPRTPSIAIPVFLQEEPLIVAVITARTPFERKDMLRTMAEQVADRLATVAAREAVARELAAARDHAMQASRAKSEFVATMSHEIRTPLNGVIGLNDLLLRTHLDEHQRRLAVGMQGAGRSLLALINDILDFSKIEAGALDLDRVPFRPRDVVEDVLALFRLEAEQRDNRLRADIDASVPTAVLGDPGRFRQVLSNLVSNAVKFTSGGSVSVRVGAATAGTGVQLRTEVRDTGIGISEPQLRHVFDPFRQGDASTTRHYGGTGLGLTIARQLAVALGGDVGATSSPGQGSTFWFTCSFDVAPGDVARPSRKTPTISRESLGHVLVVEDNETNQLVALGMLQALGYTGDVCADGADGARRALTGEYDAVLMDLQMPGTDGYEGTHLIRQGEPAGRHLPVIALTASATDGERERCVAAGMDGFLTKPLLSERLGEELARHVQEAPATVPAAVTHRNGPEEGPGEGAEEDAEEGAGDGTGDGAEAGAADCAVLDCDRLEELAEMGAAAAPLIRRAVENFVGRARDDLAEIRAAARRGDHDVVRTTAHRFKGSAANLGLVGIADLAARVEELGAPGDDHRATVERLVARLESSLDEGIQAVLRHPVVAGSVR